MYRCPGRAGVPLHAAWRKGKTPVPRLLFAFKLCYIKARHCRRDCLAGVLKIDILRVCAMIQATEKIALFIDGANLYATTKGLGFDIDYKRLLKEFQSPRLSGARLLLHGPDRGSGIFLDPPAGRLARLQRLHGGDQAGEGVHRLHRPPQGQGQHGHRARRRHAWSWPTTSTTSCCSPATAISARWSRRCSAAACASPWSPPSRPSRRWSPTSCAARPTTSSISPSCAEGRPRSGRARRPRCTNAPSFLQRRRRPGPGAGHGRVAPTTTPTSSTAEAADRRRRAGPRLPALPAPRRLPRRANRTAEPDWFNAPVPVLRAARRAAC